MQFKLSLLLASLTTLVIAIPQGTPLEGVQTLCTGPNFSEVCTQLTTTDGGCFGFPDGFQNDVSSFAPLQSWECTLFTDDNCESHPFTVTAPASTFPAGDDNTFNSVVCSLT